MKSLFSPLGKRGRASRANDRGGSLREAGKKAEAIACYQRAMAIDPTWSAPFYNLGLLHKYENEWQASLDANLRATELNPEDQAGWWNLGIAATALGRWQVARRAWRGAGLSIPEGDGPLDFPCGYNPIRLDPEDEGETVWAHRLDPARARISSIPLSDYCFGDIVLNDGAAMGYRSLRGEDIPVFNCLGLLEASPLSTWCIEMELTGKASVTVFDALDELASARGLAMEDWTSSLRLLCKACSEGTPHEQHDQELQPSAPEKARKARRTKAKSKLHRIAIAARTKGEVNDLLADWDSDARGVHVGEVEMEFSHA